MRAETTADQKQVVKARTARAHPVPGRIERDGGAQQQVELR